MKIYLTILFCLCGAMIHAQDVVLWNQVIGSGGSYTETGSLSASFTVGEAVIKTQSTSNLIATQGFQQDFEFILNIDPDLAMELELNVYPNPAVDYVKISLNQNPFLKLGFDILDMRGRKVMSQEIPQMEGYQTYEFSVQDLSQGMYVLSFRQSNGMQISNILIEKRN